MRRLVWAFAGHTYHVDGNLIIVMELSLHLSRENMFSGFPINEDSTQTAELLRLAKILKFRM